MQREKNMYFDDLASDIQINLKEPFKEWYLVAKVTERLHK